MISIILPCYNENEVLADLFSRITASAENFGEPYEVIVVDDGSEESTWLHLKELHEKDKRWKLIRFGRNFGHQTALSAGIAHADSDAVILMDADLQDPPEQLQQLIQKWKEGYQVVYAIRKKRKENFLKRGCYKLFYKILARMADTDIPLDSGDFCLMDRKVVDLLKSMPERNRFVRGMRSWVGLRQVGVEYERDARAGGKPKYTLRKLIKLATDGVISFSSKPLRLATYLGFVCSLIAMLGTLFTFVQRIFATWFASINLKPVSGFATIVISVLFLGGVQLICLGIIGEYLGRIFDEVKGRPLWTIQETVGFNRNEEPDSMT